MNKFKVTEYPEVNPDLPVLYKVYFANRYFVHKGKKLRESVDRFLDDVDRGMRDKSCPEDYRQVVDFCKKYPQVYKVVIEVLLNDTPAKLLKMEDRLFKGFKNDPETLNDPQKKAYRPEWMLREVFQERCEKCLTSGFIHSDPKSNNPCFAKKQKFKFCPNCGRLNK